MNQSKQKFNDLSDEHGAGFLILLRINGIEYSFYSVSDLKGIRKLIRRLMTYTLSMLVSKDHITEDDYNKEKEFIKKVTDIDDWYE